MKVYVVSKQIEFEPTTIVGVRRTLEEAKELAAGSHPWKEPPEWVLGSVGMAYTEQPLDHVWVAPNVYPYHVNYPVIEEMEMP